MSELSAEDAVERIVDPAAQGDDRVDVALRPEELDAFIGQPGVRENLSVFISAARTRGEAMDHVLFHGPPGLGKTTLARIVAQELGVGFRATSGPVITKAGDLAAVLTNLQPRDVLFVDEIHRLNPAVEEILYPAMEDGELDLIIGEGPAARSVRIELPPFTLVGATTRLGLLTTPLRERFGINLRLEFYSPEDLTTIVSRGCALVRTGYDRGWRDRDCASCAGHAPHRRSSVAARPGFCPRRKQPAGQSEGCGWCTVPSRRG